MNFCTYSDRMSLYNKNACVYHLDAASIQCMKLHFFDIEVCKMLINMYFFAKQIYENNQLAKRGLIEHNNVPF